MFLMEMCWDLGLVGDWRDNEGIGEVTGLIILVSLYWLYAD